MNRIGFGTDIHRLVAGRPLIIGGVTVESAVGSEGHSDGDVLMHAATDAVFGALALGDIGTHFPNSDERWSGASSSQFLSHAVTLIRKMGFEIVNLDSVIDLEHPKLRQYIDAMRTNLSVALGVTVEQVSVKAKTGELVDSVGEGRAIRAQAIVQVHRLVV